MDDSSADAVPAGRHPSAMDHTSIDIYLVIDTFLLLLIGLRLAIPYLLKPTGIVTLSAESGSVAVVAKVLGQLSEQSAPSQTLNRRAEERFLK